jgi:hypothetical protein
MDEIAARRCIWNFDFNLTDRALLPRSELGWRPGRVYFLTLLEPSRGDDRTLALTARSASQHPR